MSKKKEISMVDEITPLDLLLMDESQLRDFFAEADAVQIETEMINVQNYFDALQANRLLLHTIYEEQAAKENAARKYAHLSGPEKVALAQYLKVDGIDGSSQLGAL